MNKKISAALLILFSTLAFAQLDFAVKSHLLFPSGNASWKNISEEVTNIYNERGKGSVGFNIGLSAKTNIMGNFFVMPEVYYTTFKNEFTDPNTNTAITAKSNRVDVPVLVGLDLLGKRAGVFIGPVGSYQLSANNQYNDFKENAKNNFTVGFQFGAQVRLQKLIISGKYEAALASDKREYINNAISLATGNSYTVKYDNRPSLLQLGLGYEF